MRRRLTLLCIGHLLCLVHVAHASAPTSIHVQGRLADSTGSPLVSGVKGFTFKIFDAESKGVQVWPAGLGEVQLLITDDDGLWNAAVGETIPLTDTVFADTVRWLEITVNDGINPVTILPRVRLLTGPYAQRVATVDGASGGAITSKVTIGTGHTNTGAAAFVAGENNIARGDYSVVSGGGGATPADSNSANGYGSVVGGGITNSASGLLSTVAGGGGSTASGALSTVGGGGENQATVENATIGGGLHNTASAAGATVGGGHNNLADGWTATIPGGSDNRASGINSFAAGSAAKAHHNGSMVLSATVSLNNWDSVYTSGSQQIVLRAVGRFYLTTDSGKADIPFTDFLNTSTGAHLTKGGVWTNASDRYKKENFAPIDRATLLAKIAQLPISEWNYKSEHDDVRHIGPTAQDFYSLFGVGTDEKSISTIDPAGIALAAIQELDKRTQQIDELKAWNARLQSELSDLKRAVADLKP